MAAISTPAQRFQIGRVVSRTFGVLGRNLAAFALVALVLMAAPGTVIEWFQLYFTKTGDADAAVTVRLVSFVAMALLGSVLHASLVWGVMQDQLGKRASVGDCLSIGFRFLLPVLGVSLLAGLVEMLGFILLIIPGVFAMVTLAVVIPVVVLEPNRTSSALERSADLTRGHRWAILGLGVAYWVGLLVVSFIVGIVIGLVGAAATAGQAVLTGLLQGVIGLVAGAGLGSLYYELRSSREGAAPGLTEVFD